MERIIATAARACFRRPRQGHVGGYTVQYWRSRYTMDDSGIAPINGVNIVNITDNEDNDVCVGLLYLVEWEPYSINVFTWGTLHRGPPTEIVEFVPRRNGKRI